MGTKGTANHVYFVDEVLGVGSSASVYVGRNKKTGQLCAMKVYSDLNSDPSREFQTMQMLNHENVIKFIAVESESASKGKVLIMELSTGGSVLNMLERPEFAFGFSEEEFLVFLRDMTSALRYLRENKIVHRDIKPGNILRFVKDDMSSQYKITDFGAARELDDSDQFLSIYGTEEYLEPTAYRQALLLPNRRSGNSFNASVDLWSLGVTLYHVATGQLPFQPYGGRKNKEDMYAITSKKQSGVISGVQREPDGPIEWSEDLPKTCSLSRGLKKRLKNILCNLLECDASRRWSFEKFFRHSVDITSRKALHVVLISEFTVSRFYAAQENLESLSSFKNFLHSEAKLFSSSTMRFFHPHLSLEETFEEFCESSSASRLHIYVIPESPDEFGWKSFKVEYPLKVPEASIGNTMSWDAMFAVKSLAFVSFLERKCDDIIHLVEHLETFFHASWKDFIREVERINQLQEFLNPDDEVRKLPLTALFHKEATKMKPITQNGHFDDKLKLSSPNQLKKAPENFFEILPRMKGRVWEIHSIPQSGSVFRINELMMEKRKFRNCLNATRERITMLEKRKFLKVGEDLKEIVQKFQKQAELEKRDLSRLTHNELQIHKFDKKRIVKLTLNADRLHKAVSMNMAEFCANFGNWFRMQSQMEKILIRSCPSVTSSTIPNIHVQGLRQPLCSSPEPLAFDDLENTVLDQLDKARASEETLRCLVEEQSEQVKKLQSIFIRI